MQLDPLPPPATPPRTKAPHHGRSTLAVAGVVLASLFFIPLAPLLGLILGIIALATHRSRTLSIVAISLGGVFTLVTFIWAAVAASAFFKYVRRAKALEASTNLERLMRGATALTADERAHLLATDWTPATTACGRKDDQYPVDPAAWSGAPWTALGFAAAEPHYFQYRVRHAGDDVVLEARADLDCDGEFSRYERKIGSGGQVSELTVEKALE
jgi:hypothetical protein